MNDVLERLTTALRDRYTVERQVGQGGMATVFLAEDLKHRRRVALKVMRPELAASIGTDRFLREIELAAQLQHPHIVPVYDSGEVPGAPPILYYVMPFVEGESLRERMRREGALTVAEAVRITGEAASALGYAHEQGIIHRDVKPENILISGGHAVVADFGIARAVNAAASGGGPALTGLGVAIGTPAYMSPEQATAEALDARSDEYSLACVTYEMLAGRPAFSGSSAQSVMTANITGVRPRVRSVRKSVPEAVERVLLKALDTDPAQRYPAVTDYADALRTAAASAAAPDLRRWGVFAALLVLVLGTAGWWLFGRGGEGPVVAAAERIAIMPFRATGPGAELLGEGMVDLLSTNLNGVGGVQTVEPRTVLQQVQQRGGGTPDLETALGVARDVDAGSVLLGSVVATGPRVRLTADLYARDGVRLAQAQVDGHADSVLSLVDGLSIELMRSIWRSREPIPAMHVGGITTTSVSAMREYLAGEQFYRRAQWDSAVAHFSSAVEADSTFALANYRLATSYGWIGEQNGGAAARAGEMAVRFADRLPAREQTLVRSYKLFQAGDPAAIDSMRRYTLTYPQDPDGWYLLGEAQFHARQAFGFDPAALTDPFDRVLSIDSTLTPAAIHPLELALMHRDSAAIERYLRTLRAAGATAEVAATELAADVVWGRGPRDSLLTALANTAQFGRVGAALVGVMGAPAATSDTVLNAVQTLAATDNAAAGNLAALEPMLRAGLGRLAAAEPLIEGLLGENQQAAYGAMYTPHWAGYAPEGWFESRIADFEASAPRDNPFVLLVLANNALSDGRTAGVDSLIARALAMDSTKLNPRMRGVFEAMDGWRRLVEGDSVAGLRAMQQGLREAGTMAATGVVTPLRYHLALGLAARPDTRDRGIRLLRYTFEQDIAFSPIVAYALGKAYEAAGDRPAAVAAYGRFVRLWDKADPVLQPRVAEARRAMQELTAET